MAGKISILLLLVGLLILTSLLSGCVQEENKEKKKFYGTWIETDQIEETIYNFYSNGSLFSDYINYNTDDTHEGWGKFELVEGQLHLYTDHGQEGPESYYYDYEFLEENTQLRLTYGDIITLLVKV